MGIMINPKEGKNLRVRLKRTMYFLLVDFFVCLLLSYLLQLAGLDILWNAVIIIVSTCVFYLIFLVICAKIDKKREKKQLEDKGKDPFSK